jgi:uncharacterized protein
MNRPQPPVTPDTADWWEATRSRRLCVQRCGSCGRDQLYPRSVCTSCHGQDLALVEAAGTGTVLSFSVVHRSPDPECFPPPYVVALVRLDEGPVLTTNLVDVPDDALACDLPVRVVWDSLDDGRHLPLFTAPDRS